MKFHENENYHALPVIDFLTTSHILAYFNSCNNYNSETLVQPLFRNQPSMVDC